MRRSHRRTVLVAEGVDALHQLDVGREGKPLWPVDPVFELVEGDHLRPAAAVVRGVVIPVVVVVVVVAAAAATVATVASLRVSQAMPD